MAGLTDFSKPGFYFLKRDVIEPPECLKRQIFPGLDSWIERYENNQECEQTLSCIRFLNLLEYFRTTILQDAVILMEKYPRLYVWNHTVFSDSEFNRWRSDPNVAMSTTTEPAEFTIRAAVPVIANEIERSRHSVHQVLDVISNKIDRQSEEIYANGRRIHNLSKQLKAGFRVIPNGNFDNRMVIDSPPQGQRDSSRPSGNTQPATPPTQAASFFQNVSQEQKPVTRIADIRNRYRMRRDANMDVQSLLDEWIFCVESLENNYGTAWGQEKRAGISRGASISLMLCSPESTMDSPRKRPSRACIACMKS